MASPITATASPAYHEFHVGRARTSAAIAITAPSATRRRARKPATSAIDLDALHHGGHRLVERDLVDARRRSTALALIQALAAIGARHHDVVRAPGSIALGVSRTEERHEGRADGAGNVQRPGVA